MGMAFGITEEDIVTVLCRMNVKLPPNGMTHDEMAEEFFGEIDHGRIERAALDAGGDMDDQTNGALDEIETILKELGFAAGQLPPDRSADDTIHDIDPPSSPGY